jgi:hypothetical protein
MEPVATSERRETVRSAFLRGARTYGDLGSPLYRALFTASADDPDIVALACHAQKGAQPAFHLLACAHYLLLGQPEDPLARFYATLTDPPAPPELAFPAFAVFCATHRDALRELLETRTVQTTYVERCGILLPLISAVVDEVDEPLNLIEIGCSAAILLTLDKYAYGLDGGAIIGPQNAPLTVSCDMRGGPQLRIPVIAERIGLDLHPIDVRSDEQRRWIVALTLPELRQPREDLLTALDVVAATPIRLVEGDAVERISEVLAQTASPVCVFHSACLSYWSADSKTAFDDRLKAASRSRDIYRCGIEAPESSYAHHQGLTAGASQAAGTSELTIARYRDGRVESTVVAHGPFFGPFEWIATPAWSRRAPNSGPRSGGSPQPQKGSAHG